MWNSRLKCWVTKTSFRRCDGKWAYKVHLSNSEGRRTIGRIVRDEYGTWMILGGEQGDVAHPERHNTVSAAVQFLVEYQERFETVQQIFDDAKATGGDDAKP